MKRYQVQITRTAKQDLRDVVSYVGTQLQEHRTAQKLYRMIRENMLNLDYMPERYPLWEDEPWHSYGVRKLLVNNYVVLYLVDHEIERVRVVRVIYAGRDISKLLEETEFEES